MFFGIVYCTDASYSSIMLTKEIWVGLSKELSAGVRVYSILLCAMLFYQKYKSIVDKF